MTYYGKVLEAIEAISGAPVAEGTTFEDALLHLCKLSVQLCRPIVEIPKDGKIFDPQSEIAEKGEGK